MALDFKFDLTDKGQRLIAKAAAEDGVELEFTRLSAGAGKLTTEIPKEMNDLINPIMENLEIAELKALDHKTIVGYQVNNKDINVGFLWTETGLFAKDPDLGEILFCYANLGDTGIPIPPNTESSYSRKGRIIMSWSESKEINVLFNQSGIFALKSELDEHIEEFNNTMIVVNEKIEKAAYIIGEDGTKYRWGIDSTGIYLEEVEEGGST